MEPLYLCQEEILAYQRNRSPYLLLDEAGPVIPGESAKASRLFGSGEWFFASHFPGDPNVPGLLQVEALAQLGGLVLLTLPGHRGQVAYLVSAEKIRIRRKVVPGDRFEMEVRVTSWKRGVGDFTGRGLVGGQVATEANFQLVLPEVIKHFRVVTGGEG